MPHNYLEDKVNGFGGVVGQPAADHHKAESLHAFGGEVGDDLGNGNHDLERSCHISQQMPEDRRIRFDGNQYDGGKEQSEYTYEGDFLG